MSIPLHLMIEHSIRSVTSDLDLKWQDSVMFSSCNVQCNIHWVLLPPAFSATICMKTLEYSIPITCPWTAWFQLHRVWVHLQPVTKFTILHSFFEWSQGLGLSNLLLIKNLKEDHNTALAAEQSSNLGHQVSSKCTQTCTETLKDTPMINLLCLWC